MVISGCSLLWKVRKKSTFTSSGHLAADAIIDKASHVDDSIDGPTEMSTAMHHGVGDSTVNNAKVHESRYHINGDWDIRALPRRILENIGPPFAANMGIRILVFLVFG